LPCIDAKLARTWGIMVQHVGGMKWKPIREEEKERKKHNRNIKDICKAKKSTTLSSQLRNMGPTQSSQAS